MFEGQSTHVLDAKGRLCIPKRIQDELSRSDSGHLTCVVTRGFDGCLNMFVSAEFESVRKRLKTDAFVSPRERRMQRLVFPNTLTAQLDSSGRLLIPENLKRLAGLERDVVIAGVSDRVEIWSKDRWDAYQAEFESEFDNLDGALGQNSANGVQDGSENGAH